MFYYKLKYGCIWYINIVLWDYTIAARLKLQTRIGSSDSGYSKVLMSKKIQGKIFLFCKIFLLIFYELPFNDLRYIIAQHVYQFFLCNPFYYTNTIKTKEILKLN